MVQATVTSVLEESSGPEPTPDPRRSLRGGSLHFVGTVANAKGRQR